MTSELAALCAAVAFALFTVCGWLGLRVSTPLPRDPSGANYRQCRDCLADCRHHALFSLIISLLFLRGKEKFAGLTVIGTFAVVLGSIAIALGR